MTLVGGRAVHPVNVKVGGFYRFPTRAELMALRPQLQRALDDALATVTMAAGFDFPDFEQDHEYVSLRTDHDYPIEAGSFVSGSGHEFAVDAFGDCVTEEHVRALQRPARAPAGRQPVRRRPARPLLAQPRPALAAGPRGGRRGRARRRRAATRSGRSWCAPSSWWTRVRRGAADHRRLGRRRRPSVPVPARAGVGHGATEAPRGIALPPLRARRGRHDRSTRGIVPPTSQNQVSIEDDLRGFVQDQLHLDDRGAHPPVRAGDPQLRPVHLLRHPLPRPHAWSEG